jgi:hypothetical protein
LRQHDSTPASITARERIELVSLSADHAHLSYLRTEEETVLTVTLIGAAFLFGLFIGAGIYEACARKHREQTEQAILQLALCREEIDGLIEATGQLATLNYHILQAQAQEKEHRRQLEAFAVKFQGKPS